MKHFDDKEEYEAQSRKQRKCLSDKSENNDHNHRSAPWHVYHPFQFRALGRKLYNDYDNDSDFIPSWNLSRDINIH